MGTVSLIITIVSLAIIALTMLLGIRRGLRGTVIKIVSVILAVFLAFVITKILASAFGGLVKDLIDRFGSDLPAEINKLLETSDSFVSITKSGVMAVASPFVFTVVFIIVFFLMLIPEHFVKKALLKNGKGSTAGGVIASVAVGVVIVMMVLMPFAGISRSVRTVKTNLDSVSGETAAEIKDKYDEYVDPIASNPCIRITSIVTSPLYDSLSVIRTDDASTSLYNAADVGTRLAADVLPLADNESGKFTAKQAESIKAFAKDFEKTEILPSFAGDVLSSAAKEWKKGNTYLDFSFDEYDETGKFGELFDTMYDILGSSDKNTVKSDVSEAAKLFSLLAEKDAFDLTEDGADVQEVLKREGLISGVVNTVYSYDRFRPITADFINIALDYAGESLELDDQTKRELRLDKSNLPGLSTSEMAEESLRIEHTAVQILDFVSSVSEDDILSADIVTLGKALDNATDSVILGSKVKLLIKSVLKSANMQKYEIFSDKMIDKIIDGDISYEKTFEATEKAINVIKTVEDAAGSGKPVDFETAKESIGWLVENMDTSVSDVISTAITPEFIVDCGFPEENASKVADLFSGYFDKLGKTENMSSASLEAETKCISVIYSAAAAGNDEKEAENIIGGVIESPEELIGAFMDSEIFASSVIETVYDGGKTVIDPFGTSEYLSESDEKAISETLESYVKENYKNSSDKKSFEEKIISVGSVFGMDLTSSFRDWVK